MNESIKKMYEQEPKTWYAKIIVALIVAALLAWSLSTVQSTGSNGSLSLIHISEPTRPY